MFKQVTGYLYLLVFSFFFFLSVFPQDTSYYKTVSVDSPTFPADLEVRIRSPFTSRTYSDYRDILIPNYESTPTGVGTQRSVSCAYSGYTVVYTPPLVKPFFDFNGLDFSREHTYCQSWWDVASTTNPYYSDYHHLFLTQQSKVNGMRGNYPLGDCATVTTAFLECKFGKNALGQTVFEPRPGDKGDAARGMMYMVVMYDHNGAYGNWSFKWLNETKIPSTPQDIQTLLNWSKQDPPDKWEVERNNYISTLQQNRNPFVDHPEYLKYINLYDMSMLNPVFSPEPTYQVSNFSAAANGYSITVNWTNPTNGQLPSGYLLQAYNVDNYFIPCDGDVYPDSTDLSTGKALINIPYSAAQSYTFNNLPLGSHYYFTIYSYNGTDTLINYKIDGKQRTDVSTDATPVELVSFNAAIDQNNINLNWKTATELNNSGFSVERGSVKNSDGELIFNKIGFVKGAGNSVSPVSYSYSDKLNNPGVYYYRLKQIDNNGSFKYNTPVEVNFKPVVKGYYLEQNFPNPFNPSTTITYSLPEASNVKLSVFNALGQQVKIVENVYKNSGSYKVTLNADDLNSGIYFYKIEAGKFSQIRKMILVK
ncbi:MAG: endonuclease [Ignavibacteriaceae bacterium]|nr:endonuclease [Ignavibacteriaceae bacterium]